MSRMRRHGRTRLRLTHGNNSNQTIYPRPLLRTLRHPPLPHRHLGPHRHRPGLVGQLHHPQLRPLHPALGHLGPLARQQPQLHRRAPLHDQRHQQRRHRHPDPVPADPHRLGHAAARARENRPVVDLPVGQFVSDPDAPLF